MIFHFPELGYELYNNIMENVTIKDEYIKLGQLLKLSGLVDSGSVAKIVIGDGMVEVNGEIETRRGKKIYPGDIITFEDNSIKVIK